MSKKFNRLFALLIVLALMLSFAAACSPKETETVEEEAPAAEEAAAAEEEAVVEEEEPLELVYAATSILTTPNPTIGWSHYYIRGWTLEQLLNDALLMGIQPGMAEEWSVDESGMVWTFKIHEGVKFHDGTICDAHAVAWSLNFTMDMELPTMISYLEGVTKVEAVDDLTVEITTEEPMGPFESKIAGMGMFILPESVWGDMTIDEIMEYQEIDAAIGTGPYKLVEFVPNEYVIYEAFEDYWNGKPAIDRLIFRELSNADAINEALRSGEVDFAYIGADAKELLSAEDHLEVLTAPGFGIDELIVNSFAEGTQPDSLNDIVVRQAMSMAIDKQQIINVVSLGTTTPGWSLLTPDNGMWYNTDVEPLPYDPDAANALLDEAGYVDTDDDGIRNYSDGSNIEYRIYSPDSMTNGPRIIEMTAENLKAIGIGSDPQVLSEETVISLFPSYDFDILYWGWGWGGADPDFPMSCFTCDQTGEGGWNDAGYCSPTFDELYAAQARETDPEARKEIIWEMQEVFYNDLPYIVLQYDVNNMVINKDKFGFMLDMISQVGNPTLRHTLINIER